MYYARDDRPWAGPDPPAVAYVYASGRGAVHAREHLAAFSGVLQVDGFQAYKTLPITLAYCWSHARRKVRDAQRQGGSPVAEEALRRIAALYRIETEIRGRLAEERLAARRARSAPLVADMRAWLDE